jgi:peptidyl-dipeptidase Dcp
MIGSTMLSMNAQGNSDNPLLKKNGQDHMAVFLLSIYHKLNQPFDVAIKERLMEIEAIANNPKALTFEKPSLKWNALVWILSAS